MAKNYFERYIWLIDTINRHGHISFKRISDLWEYCPLNDRRGEPLSNPNNMNHPTRGGANELEIIRHQCQVRFLAENGINSCLDLGSVGSSHMVFGFVVTYRYWHQIQSFHKKLRKKNESRRYLSTYG